MRTDTILSSHAPNRNPHRIANPNPIINPNHNPNPWGLTSEKASLNPWDLVMEIAKGYRCNRKITIFVICDICGDFF